MSKSVNWSFRTWKRPTGSSGNGDAFSGSNTIGKQYGLDGAGQTIAVIDSGIAFDHIAFGSGFGTGHRVVGGYDFAENDADPYDDGPVGLHGTHVAGIIAADSDQFSGLYARCGPGVAARL